MKRRVLVGLIVLATLLIVIQVFPAVAHSETGGGNAASLGTNPGAQPAGATPPSAGTIYWRMWLACAKYMYPIGFCLILGIFLALETIRVLWLDRVRSGEILTKDLRMLGQSERNLLLAGVKPSRLTKVFRAIDKLKASQVPDQEIKADIQRQIDFHHGKFNAFRGWMEFLSESEGALGLLGTVEGIYVAFTSGALASANTDKLLVNLGLALATTFFGLVATIVLNAFITWTFKMHSTAMDTMLEKGQEYLAALEMEQTGSLRQPQ